MDVSRQENPVGERKTRTVKLVLMGTAIGVLIGAGILSAGYSLYERSRTVTNATGELPKGYSSRPLSMKPLGGGLNIGVFQTVKTSADGLIAAIYSGKKFPRILSAQVIRGVIRDGISDSNTSVYNFKGFKMIVVFATFPTSSIQNSVTVFVDTHGTVIPAGSFPFGSYSSVEAINKNAIPALNFLSNSGFMQGIILMDGMNVKIIRYDPSSHLLMTNKVSNASQVIPIEEGATPYIDVTMGTDINGDPTSIANISGAYISQRSDPNTGLVTITVKSGMSVAINDPSSGLLGQTVYSGSGISYAVGNESSGPSSQSQNIGLASLMPSFVTPPMTPGEYHFVVEGNNLFYQFIVHVQ